MILAQRYVSLLRNGWMDGISSFSFDERDEMMRWVRWSRYNSQTQLSNIWHQSCINRRIPPKSQRAFTLFTTLRSVGKEGCVLTAIMEVLLPLRFRRRWARLEKCGMGSSDERSEERESGMNARNVA